MQIRIAKRKLYPHRYPRAGDREIGESAADPMFQTAWKRFGIVLIDSPPNLAASGAHLFAEIAESVLLAVCAGSADRNEVRKAKERLDQTGTPALGAVLNQCNPKNHGRGRASRLTAIARRPKMSAGMEQVTKRKPEGESQAEVAIALTIIIPSYNTRELLSDCLGSISSESAVRTL